MNYEAMWSERVEAWLASGLTSKAFCEGKEFTAGGLRHWAYRLRQTRPRKQGTLAVRVAKVVPVPRPSPVPEPAPPSAPLVLEVGGVRIAVRPGFDRPTLAAVVDVLSARGGLS